MEQGESLLGVVANLILILAVILAVAKIGGFIFGKFLKIPQVIGELAGGIIISPFALGGVKIGNLGPLFETHELAGSVIPVQSEIYFLSQVAAVLLLFYSGLETDRKLFLKYSKQGSLVALGGVVLPFVLGLVIAVAFGYGAFTSVENLLPALFVGVALTATSVAITARVLNDLGHLRSPSGVTVLAAAVVDDIIGVLLLSLVVAIKQSGGTLDALEFVIILAKAAGFIVIVLGIGIFAEKHISRLLNKIKSTELITTILLIFAFSVAAIAEIWFGLAMIIGAYLIGLVFSGSEIKPRVEKQITTISSVFTSIFFVVIGMQADFSSFGTSENSVWIIVGFVVTITLAAVISKIVGSGVPALFSGFSKTGSWRIGIGMMPRGEVALIVAGIGLSAHVISSEIYSALIIMTIFTTVLAPIILSKSYKKNISDLKNDAP